MVYRTNQYDPNKVYKIEQEELTQEEKDFMDELKFSFSAKKALSTIMSHMERIGSERTIQLADLTMNKKKIYEGFVINKYAFDDGSILNVDFECLWVSD